MRARPLVMLLIGASATAGVLSAACGGDDFGPGGEGFAAPPTVTVTIHGTVRSETDSTPVAGVHLTAYRLTCARCGPDSVLANTRTGPTGEYTISFRATCEAPYGMWPYAMRPAPPFHHVTGTRCPTSPRCRTHPLPPEACGDWPFDLWVRMTYGTPLRRNVLE
jgi:hypothetical protein